MSESGDQTDHQIFLAGQLLGAIMKGDNPREIKIISKLIDPDVLQAYVEKRPEGFVYSEQIQQAIRLARTFKSLSKS